MGLIAAFLLPIIHDAEFHIIDPFDWLMNPKSLIELTDAHKGTHCWMPSFAFNHMAKKVPLEMVKHLKLDSLERVISCSEPTFYDDLANFRDKFASVGLKSTALCVCYALAENIFAVSQSDTIEETEWKGAKYTSCGNVLEQVSVRIIRDGMDVTTKDDGTVMISSPFEPRTNKKSEGYYNTGDIGFFKDQKLYIIGREKDLFVSYGVNVYPEIIEHLVANIEGVVPGRVVCFGVHSKEQGTNKVVVCVETENVGNNKLRTELSAIIREEFGLTAIVILVVPGSLIKTSSGKFCRIKNKEAYGNINA
jgi:acyl-CoA synthetase (AMP-forming)/AMP-acid ligase II